LRLFVRGQGFGELNLVTGVVVHAEVAISPGLAQDSLRDASATLLRFDVQRVEIFGEDVDSDV
jgi:hypothetical protein